jgi:glycerol kinase
MLRSMLALFALVTLLHPDEATATAVGAATLAGTLAGIWRHRIVAGPKGELQAQPAQ